MSLHYLSLATQLNLLNTHRRNLASVCIVRFMLASPEPFYPLSSVTVI